MTPRAAIIATVGPTSETIDVLCAMSMAGMDAARLNIAWTPSTDELHKQINAVRSAIDACGRPTIIIADFPSRRVAQQTGHSYDPDAPLFTPSSEVLLDVCIQERVDYLALSFVGSAKDVDAARTLIHDRGGTQKIIAKIERQAALDSLDEIRAAADAVMVARGDLSHEIPPETIPSVQADIVRRAKAVHKPVIVATQMLLSMTEHTEPTSAEVADVAEAVVEGADAVMLSEETATGKHPAEAVAMMARIVQEAQTRSPHPLTPL